MLESNWVSEVVVSTELTEGFLSGLFATEGILGVSSCIESIEPIGRSIDDIFHRAVSVQDYLEDIG